MPNAGLRERGSAPPWEADPADWWRSVLIDAGSRDGVRANMAVLTAEGLVGRVSEVGFDRSRVLMVGDPNCRIATQVLQPGYKNVLAKGIIAPGSSSLDRLLVDLTYVPGGSLLKPGQSVVTSGDGGEIKNGFYPEFGDMITGVIQRYEGGVATVQLNNVEAILPRSEQIPGETFHSGDRVRAAVAEVRKRGMRVQVVLSRTRPSLEGRFSLPIVAAPDWRRKIHFPLTAAPRTTGAPT